MLIPAKTKALPKVAKKKVVKKATKKSSPVLSTDTVNNEPNSDDFILESEPYDGTKLGAILFRITSRYEYYNWLKVIFGVYNSIGGDDFGLELVHKINGLP